ncbi:MAG: hypothetical protein PHG18_03305 [Bacilli bacterium]|nr:hypothetical protein [Bacilli bacterium]
MKKEKRELTKKQHIGILSQLILTFFILVFLFMTIGEPVMMEVVNKILVLLFLVMAYNNHILLKRKGFTVTNRIVALWLSISMLFS